jgi:hypothetical protein
VAPALVVERDMIRAVHSIDMRQLGDGFRDHIEGHGVHQARIFSNL